jgi:hypothetical protein
VDHLKDASLGLVLALPVNIRLGWKGSLGTYTLAYYENPKITDKKSLITLAPVRISWKNTIQVSLTFASKAGA